MFLLLTLSLNFNASYFDCRPFCTRKFMWVCNSFDCAKYGLWFCICKHCLCPQTPLHIPLAVFAASVLYRHELVGHVMWFMLILSPCDIHYLFLLIELIKCTWLDENMHETGGRRKMFLSVSSLLLNREIRTHSVNWFSLLLKYLIFYSLNVNPMSLGVKWTNLIAALRAAGLNLVRFVFKSETLIEKHGLELRNKHKNKDTFFYCFIKYPLLTF